MRRRSELVLLLSLVLIALLGPALPARAERIQSGFVLIREGDVVSEDLYVAGNSITIAGRVEGDVLAVAFGEIRIDGVVTGSVTALSSSLVVSGAVGGSVRAAAGDVEVTGEVGGDVFTAGVGVHSAPEARIGRDLLVWAWTADLAGRIARDLEGQQRDTTIDALVGRDVEVTVSSLTVGPVTEVSGDLSYRSESEAEISEGAVVEGTLLHTRPLPMNVRIRGLLILATVLAFAGTTALGIAMLWAVPDRAGRAYRTLLARPLASLGWGVGVIAIPVALMALAGLVVGLSPPEAGIPLLVVFLPLVAAALGLVFIGALLAPVASITAVGRLALPERSSYAAFVAGMAGLLLLSFVPYLGTVLVAVAVVTGLGAWVASVGGTPSTPT